MLVNEYIRELGIIIEIINKHKAISAYTARHIAIGIYESI
jgi:hypothetical protein